MRTGHRIGVVAAAAMSIVSLATAVPAVAAPSEAPQRGNGPRPVSQVLPAVDAGESEWVRLRWRTDRRICDVEVVVHGNDDVEIDYPSDREFTSFSRGDSLGRGRTDFTAFRVDAQPERAEFVLLAAVISYTDCRRRAPVLTYTTGLMLPVRS